jgi:uncharacterized protein involved in outer membrane biogenesis
MAIRHRTRFILIVIASLFVVAGLLVPVLLNPDRYRPRVISYLQARTGKPVEIGHLSLALYPHVAIRVDDFGMKNPAEFPSDYFLKVGRIDAKLDARALLHRQVVIKSLVLQDPLINLVSDPDGPWNFENPGSKESWQGFPLGVIGRIEIKGGQLIASNLLPSDAPGPIFFEANNVSSMLEQVDLGAFTRPSSSSLAAQGTLNAGFLRFGRVEVKNVSSKLRLLTKEVFFTEVKAEAYAGTAAGNLFFNLAGRNTRFSTNARMSGIDMAHLLAAFREGRGKMTGRMEGDLKLAGEVEHTNDPLDGIYGTGHVVVRNGKVPSLKLNENVMKLLHFNDLGPAAQDPSSFSSISADLRLTNLRISSSEINFIGYGVDVQGSGTLTLRGSDSLDYHGVAMILAKQGFFTRIVARLSGATVKDGLLSFPFRVGGTVSNPNFSMGK